MDLCFEKNGINILKTGLFLIVKLIAYFETNQLIYFGSQDQPCFERRFLCLQIN